MHATIIRSTAAIVFAVLGTVAQAAVITGPTLNENDGGWSNVGIGFTAKDNSTLTSFIYESESKADTIELLNKSGTVLDSISIPGGSSSNKISVSWSLTSGTQYYLLGSTDSNEQFTSYGSAAPSDADIALTDTGIFSESANPASFGITGNSYWAAFNDITTSSAVPEPATLVLFALGLFAFAVTRRSKQ